MRSTRSVRKSKSLPEIDIQGFYELNPGALWRGFKAEGLAFWALCFYLMYEYLRPDLVYPVIGILPLGLMAIFTSFFAMFADKSVKWVKTPVTIQLVLFYAIVFSSVLTAFMPDVSMDYISIPVNWVLFYILVVHLVNSEKRFFLFLLFFFLVNLKMSQFGFRSFVGRGFTFEAWGVSGSPGWFENGGDIALQMTIFIPLVMVFIYTLRKYWSKGKKYLLYILPITGVFTLVGASSRGALLAFACVCAWYLLKTKVGIKAIASLLLLGVLFWQILPEGMIEKFQSSGEDSTSQSRLALWGKGMDAAMDKPLLGVGFENWFEYCWANNPRGIGRDLWCLDLHNTYVEAAAETGFIGLGMYILMNLSGFLINANTRKLSRKMNHSFILHMSHGMDAGLVGYIVSSMFLSVLFYPMFWLHLAMIVALRTIAQNMYASRPETEDSHAPARRHRYPKMTKPRASTR